MVVENIRDHSIVRKAHVEVLSFKYSKLKNLGIGYFLLKKALAIVVKFAESMR